VYEHARNNPDLDIHAYDVAEYILRVYQPMDAMKLQKLCYYTQAWSLAWGRGPMFSDDIEAWENGPVVRSLFSRHRGKFTVETVGGNIAELTTDRARIATITDVMNFYGGRTGQDLSELAHMEAPWKVTRDSAGVCDGEACDEVINPDLMQAYYASLIAEDTRVAEPA
jgi:uncharacterized phage-associated protein